MGERKNKKHITLGSLLTPLRIVREQTNHFHSVPEYILSSTTTSYKDNNIKAQLKLEQEFKGTKMSFWYFRNS